MYRENLLTIVLLSVRPLTLHFSTPSTFDGKITSRVLRQLKNFFKESCLLVMGERFLHFLQLLLSWSAITLLHVTTKVKSSEKFLFSIGWNSSYTQEPKNNEVWWAFLYICSLFSTLLKMDTKDWRRKLSGGEQLNFVYYE